MKLGQQQQKKPQQTQCERQQTLLLKGNNKGTIFSEGYFLLEVQKRITYRSGRLLGYQALEPDDMANQLRHVLNCTCYVMTPE